MQSSLNGRAGAARYTASDHPLAAHVMRTRDVVNDLVRFDKILGVCGIGPDHVLTDEPDGRLSHGFFVRLAWGDPAASQNAVLQSLTATVHDMSASPWETFGAVEALLHRVTMILCGVTESPVSRIAARGEVWSSDGSCSVSRTYDVLSHPHDPRTRGV